MPTSNKNFSTSLRQANRIFASLAISRCQKLNPNSEQGLPYFISKLGAQVLASTDVEAIWPLYATNVSLFTVTLGENPPTSFNPFNDSADRFGTISTESLISIIAGKELTIDSKDAADDQTKTLERWLISTFLSLSSQSHNNNLTDASLKFGIPSHIIHNLSKLSLDLQTVLVHKGYFQLAWRFDNADFWLSLRRLLEKRVVPQQEPDPGHEAELLTLAIQMFKDY